MKEPDVGRRVFIKRAACGGLALAGGVALFDPTKACAQGSEVAWPNRPVRFIVPLAPGGGLDHIARVVGEYMGRATGQQVVIENRTGAGGTIGIDTAMKSAPDGYSVLISNDNVASAPHVLRLNVDYAKELVPVSQLGRQVLALAVHPSLGVSSMAELLAAARERPGLGCATSGVGSNQHVLLEWIVKVAGVRLDHVPYRGAGQAINDLVAGHVQIGLLGPTALIPHYRAGTLRLLAQSSETRSPSLPEVPTLQEAGLAEVVLETWYGAFVPLGTPQPIVARLNAELDKALADPATRKTLQQTATEPVGGAPEQLARVVQSDSEKYARLIKELNIRAN
jgi:tripartite-type tricarboxylate transporter receptor subunit TctC